MEQPAESTPDPGLPAIEFELCAESLEACVAARDGGADRIELCTALDLGGLTPSHGLIRESLRRAGLPVHTILRPRAGDFVYTGPEFDLILADLRHARELGVSGVVVGLLDHQGKVDIERTRQIATLAHPLEVTFHRAFDCVRDLPQALEDVIASGCRRLLTSGGRPDVSQGAEMLGRLVVQAAARIQVAVGGGLRLTHAAEVARTTQATAFHGSLRRQATSPHACLPGESCLAHSVEAEDVRVMIRTLRTALGSPM